MVLDLGIAFLQASAVGVGGLERETAVDTPLQITPVLIQGGGCYGVTTLVDFKGTQQHRLHARGKHRIPCLEGKLTILDLIGQTDWPLLGRAMLLGTTEFGHPDSRSMAAQDLVHDPVDPAWANPMHTDLVILKDPFPLGSAMHPCAGFITADQPAVAHTGQNLRHPVLQTGVAHAGRGWSVLLH